MATLHCDHRDAQSTLIAAVEQFVETAESLSDFDLLATSRCHGWTVLDVLVHVRTGLQEMLGGVVAPTQEPADQDAASYWRDYIGENDQIDSILWTRRTSSAYRRPTDAVRHLRMAADAVVAAVGQLQESRVRFQNHILTSGDFQATWAVELAVHQLDLGHTLAVAAPTRRSVVMARMTVEALLDTRLTGDWSDTVCTLLGAGRQSPNANERKRLGPAATRLPVLG